ncbi:DUF4249 domain-containing protein [Rhodocytophaga aerolata]|uniref:DUF4249 domain-containing protein n=1 Tax=Rhodocytophaga aerolata TaxID=455078 RepID=A0ABT8RBD6_9BACT|nr:DUF4249 domain-containing protein [Rhodocytophaga aerolata]MDO1449314.1 DUF4249 domain-containing protein [Rhodocytophaga aerolata]
MKQYRNAIYIGCLLAMLTGSCVDPYNPPAIAAAESYLVVEGFINSGSDPSVFTLSRTRKQANAGNFIPEVDAQVSIEGENGERYTLAEQTEGTYASSSLTLNPTTRYRIHILTQRKEYASDYVPVKSTPPIDSVTWTLAQDGIQLFVTTHDPENNTRYYRWDAEETWEYVSAFFSNYQYKDKQMFVRYDDDLIFTCWRSDQTKQIYLGSSARLTDDVIYKQPIMFTPVATGKLMEKYSILVKQYALSQQGFEYWQILEKNTESTGSIFDAQPSQLQGNIHCLTNPQEPVIGFVDASSIQQKRIFIVGRSLPFRTINIGYETCDLDTVPNTPQHLEDKFGDGYFVPVNPIGSSSGIIAYTYSINQCVDCREKGGTTSKPDFWQ